MDKVKAKLQGKVCRYCGRVLDVVHQDLSGLFEVDNETGEILRSIDVEYFGTYCPKCREPLELTSEY